MDIVLNLVCLFYNLLRSRSAQQMAALYNCLLVIDVYLLCNPILQSFYSRVKFNILL